jgi:hypothetical protein
MRLGGRSERLVDADVKLSRANLKPTTAARAQRFGLFDLLQFQQATEEVTSLVLASLWSRKLNMVDVDYQHPSNVSSVSS